MNVTSDTLRIGWAQADITPSEPVQIIGQFATRISEGIENPLTATALVMEGYGDQVVFVSCDLVYISKELRDGVRAGLADGVKGLDPKKVILHATHTHTAPEVRLPEEGWSFPETAVILKLPVMPVEDYLAFAVGRITQAVTKAWNFRATGRIAFGLGHAVVGHNRRWVNVDGVATMYGNTDTSQFSHIEGYEDHTVGVLATRDEAGRLTGLMVNVPCPAQVTESLFVLSADYWHETRQELRHRLGKDVHILAQCSAAGDQSPHPLYEKRAETRMLERANRTEREELAQRIADGVENVLETLGDHTDAAEPLRHSVASLELPLFGITQEHVRAALEEAKTWQERYEQEKRRLEADPSLRDDPRWYVKISEARNFMNWLNDVADRYERQKIHTGHPCELHVLRLGDVVIATNPFEYYLDFGTFIKARSPAVQTFLVQLAGPGGYVPTLRSIRGGGYGSVPASYVVGPEGGRRLAEKTVECLHTLWT